MKIIRSMPDPEENRPGLSGRDDSATSKDAAQLITPRTGTQRALVLAAIAHSRFGGVIGGATDSEIEAMTGLSYSQFGPRRRELMTGGWVEWLGDCRRSLTSTAEQNVWVLTAQGRIAWKNHSQDDYPLC